MDKQLPSNNPPRRWTSDDDIYLMEMWDAGVSIEAMAKVLDRTVNAINARLIKHLDAKRMQPQGELF